MAPSARSIRDERYASPKVTTLRAGEIVEFLGPAVAAGSVVAPGIGGGEDGTSDWSSEDSSYDWDDGSSD